MMSLKFIAILLMTGWLLGEWLKRRSVGTKSVLFGAHCFFIHPWFVARAWWRLYGFPRDPRLWIAFFVHDLGYLGKPNMDGPEGEGHVFLGAKIMGYLFDRDRWDGSWFAKTLGRLLERIFDDAPTHRPDHLSTTWYCLSFYHSRFMAKRYGTQPSLLCYADKLSITLTPAWLYLLMARASGELAEYLAKTKEGKYVHMNIANEDVLIWYKNMQTYLVKWVADHKDGAPDQATPLT